MYPMRLILAFCLALVLPWVAPASATGAPHCGGVAHGSVAGTGEQHTAHAATQPADAPADSGRCDCGCACAGSHCASTHTVMLARGAAHLGPVPSRASWRIDAIPSDPLDPHHRSILRPPDAG